MGYGDLYPTTAEGRLVAGALMIGGIALLGVVTGMVASWFVEKINGLEQSLEDSTHRELRAVHAELAALRARLDCRATAPRRRHTAGPDERANR